MPAIKAKPMYPALIYSDSLQELRGKSKAIAQVIIILDRMIAKHNIGAATVTLATDMDRLRESLQMVHFRQCEKIALEEKIEQERKKAGL